MYSPAAFAVTDPTEIAAMLARAPLACLITHGAEGLFASHLPMIHDARRGTLSGHLARANPHRDHADDGLALVVFKGPDAYVTPGWYPSKAEHGRVVPTWNYEAVHVQGHITWREDPDWLHANVEALTHRFEADRPNPWSLDDAPPGYIDALVGGIIGVELQIVGIKAKRKLSQNRPAPDREGVIAGLAGQGDPMAAMMAALKTPTS